MAPLRRRDFLVGAGLGLAPALLSAIGAGAGRRKPKPRPTPRQSATPSPSPSPTVIITSQVPSTPAPSLFVTNVLAIDVDNDNARITWDVSDFATGQVEYGTSTAYGSTSTLEPSFNFKSHSQLLSALASNTLYHFRVRSQDAQGRWAISGDFTFTTLPPPAFAIYGPGIGGDTLMNTQLGNVGASQTKKHYFRFKAPVSSALNSITFYYQTGGGYGAGTGGTWTLEVYADDGTANHWPTGSALASQSVAASAVSTGGKVVTFSSPASLVAGTLYHLVFTNTDGAPSSNYFSTNHWGYRLVTGGGNNGTFDGRLNPRFLATDWEHGYFTDPSGPWVKRAGYAPVCELTFADGTRHGNCYGEASLAGGQQGEINGTSKMARERIIVSGGDKTVRGFGIRIGKISGGTDALTVGLYSSDGTTLIDSFTIAASAIANLTGAPNGADSDQGNGSQAKWVEGTFASPRTLTNTSTYYVRLSTAAGTTYWVWVNREFQPGLNYGAGSGFADGQAQATTDSGSTWPALGSGGNNHDLQCYFTL